MKTSIENPVSIDNTALLPQKEVVLRMVIVKNVTYSYYAVEMKNKEEILSQLDVINNLPPLKVDQGSNILISCAKTNSEEIMKTLIEGSNEYTWISSTLEECVHKL